MAELVGEERAEPGVNEPLAFVGALMPLEGVVNDRIDPVFGIGSSGRQDIHHELFGVEVPESLKALLRVVGHVEIVVAVIDHPVPVDPFVQGRCLFGDLSAEVLSGRQGAARGR